MAKTHFLAGGTAGDLYLPNEIDAPPGVGQRNLQRKEARAMKKGHDAMRARELAEKGESKSEIVRLQSLAAGKRPPPYKMSARERDLRVKVETIMVSPTYWTDEHAQREAREATAEISKLAREAPLAASLDASEG